MRSKLLVLVLLAALAAVTWALFGAGLAPAPSALAGSPAPAVIADATDFEVSALATPHVAAQLLDIEQSERIDVALSSDELREIEVIDAATGDPVPGAEIRWVDLGRSPEWAKLGSLSDYSQLEELIASRGRRTTAEDLGHARIPRTQGEGAVTALFDGRWGMESISHDGEAVLQIALHPDADLRVQVVDSLGAAIPGRDVELIAGPNSTLFVSATARTHGAEGIATLHHAGWAMAREPSSEWAVALEGPAGFSARATVRTDSLGGAPIRLIHPDTGDVEVIVLEPDGQPARGQILVRMDCRETSKHEALRAAQGRAVFRTVDLGLELACFANRDFLLGPSPAISVRGPTRPGERVQAVIHMGKGHPIATGRLLLAADRPLRQKRFRASLFIAFDGKSATHEIDTRTDEAGRFRFDLAPVEAPSEVHELTLAWSGDAVNPPADVKRVFREALPNGVQDLGDVELEPIPLLASGQVVRGRGQADPDVRVLVHVGRKTLGPELDWSPCPDLATTSRPDGSFEVRGHVPCDRLRLLASPMRSLGAEVPVGAEGVVLHSVVSGSIEGSLVADRSLPRLHIECHPTAPVDVDPDADLAPVVYRRGEDFCFPELSPGHWTVSIRIATEAEPFFEVEGVMVRLDEVCRDYGLQGIPVSSLLQSRE